MDTISLEEAEAQLSALIDRVEAGETVAITREGEGKEVARLSPPQTPRRRIDIEELRALTDQMRMRCRRIHAPDARRRTLLTFYVDASSSRAKRSDPD